MVHGVQANGTAPGAAVRRRRPEAALESGASGIGDILESAVDRGIQNEGKTMKPDFAQDASGAFQGCQGSRFSNRRGIQAIKRLLNGSIAVNFSDDTARKTSKLEIFS
jgi:hypothetical protein